MRAIELYPYWDDDRALLVEMVTPLADADLAFRPGPGLASLGAILRHVITTEEHWWHGGVLGEPYATWRPEGWDRFTGDEKDAHRARRFPTVAAIRDGLRAAHAPVAAFLGGLDAWALCEKRQATWGESNTLRWIFWHLVEHDQHHRAQVYTRLRMLGYDPPPIWPRPTVMGWTPATRWSPGEEEVKHIVPYWDHVHAVLRQAVASLSAADLTVRLSADLPTLHDLVLHIVIWEDFLVRQILGEERDRDWGHIEGSDWRIPVGELGARIGSRFPSAEALVEALEKVHGVTRAFLDRLTLADLPQARVTPWGEATVHYLLWYAREHTVHHRAQLFLRMRMLGRTPPEP
jgi:uncharacterized damage-inducible protein DinB